MVRVRRFRLSALMFLLVALAGSPALWTAAQDSPGTSEEHTWTPAESTEGTVGPYQFTDLAGDPGVRCVNDLRSFPGDVAGTLTAASLSVMPTRDSQVVGARANFFQQQPSGAIELITQSDIVIRTASGSTWVPFSDISFTGLPVGPIYLAQLEIFWYDHGGQSVEGSVRRPIRFYQRIVHREGGTVVEPPDDVCHSPDQPVVVAATERGIVNSHLAFDLIYFPIDVPLQVRWDSTRLDSVQTDDRGEVHGSFRIPAAPMGPHTIRWFTGDWTASATFTVVPRIKITPGLVARGQTVDVSLRGYAAREIVRIRWQNGASWEEVARVTTSGTGSANIDVAVPAWAPDGANSVRGDSIASGGGRAQTNAVEVMPDGSIHLSPERGTVNSLVTASLADFPPHQPVTVTFRGFYETTATGMTDDAGRAVLSFRVPASPFGPHDVEASGGTTATTIFDVAPRIKITPGEAAPGDAVNVSLRGYAARELVRIRWHREGGYEQLATVTTSGSGSANLNVVVPSWAPAGATSVRGDGTIARAQTNAFVVAGGALESAAGEATVTPLPTATPIGTLTPEIPTLTAEPTMAPDPSVTVEPTLEPTAAPTEESTPVIEPSATAEPTPTETPTTPIADDET
ncbi:MAG: hypothetical protein ACRDJW_25215 [Thermomicrobiales bacterium]